MAKDSLGRKAARRPVPPPYRDGDSKTRYRPGEGFRTVTLDDGAFLYLWEYVHLHAKAVESRTYLSDELRGVAERINLAFEEQAQDYIPTVEAAPKSERGGSGKKERCPDCGTKKPKKVKKKGVPKWKCLECDRVWDRNVPGEAPQKPSEGLEAGSEGDDTAERPRKRQKPAKKKQKAKAKA
jgi:ribosomal protein L37AE/L43A